MYLPMKIWIKNATIVNEGETFVGSVLIDNEKISKVIRAEHKNQYGFDPQAEQIINAQGLYLIPGVIDDHVHFREPGLTHKADIESESCAAAAGGVTSYMDMPNVQPLTTDLEKLEAKYRLGAEKSRINYSFFFGATNTNAELLPLLDPRKVCGVKLFMGSSTGNMLVDQYDALLKIFSSSPLPIMAHCEDSAVISRNLAYCQTTYGKDPEVIHHPEIRSEEACYRSTKLAVELACQTGARLHVAHVTTARELELFDAAFLTTNNDGQANKRITAEACVAHLLYSNLDYSRLGTRIKCNPAIKTPEDREALRRALNEGTIDVVGTDHAPHLISEKEGGCTKAVSGMPMIQFSLVSMLKLADEGVLSVERVVELMCHAPARLFNIEGRGFIREGAQADLVLLYPDRPWTLHKEQIISKCGWSPLEGESFNWSVEKTFCNGHLVYNEGHVDSDYRGQPLTFNR